MSQAKAVVKGFMFNARTGRLCVYTTGSDIHLDAFKCSAEVQGVIVDFAAQMQSMIVDKLPTDVLADAIGVKTLVAYPMQPMIEDKSELSS